MTTWSKRYGEVALEEDFETQDPHAEPRGCFFHLLPNKLKILTAIGFIIVTVLAVVLISLKFMDDGNHELTQNKNLSFGKDVPIYNNEASCSEKLLNFTAADMLSNLNLDVDPCDNFYDFACGGWEKDNSIPDGKDWWNPWEEEEQRIEDIVIEMMAEEIENTKSAVFLQAKLLYEGCMKLASQDIAEDECVLNLVRETLEFYGGLPIISGGDQWNPNKFNWMKSLVGLKQRFNRPVILDINSYRDIDGEVGKNIINISKPETDYEDSKLYLPWSTYIVDLSKQIMNTKDTPNISELSLQKQASEIKNVIFELKYNNRLRNWKFSEFRKLQGHTENFCYITISRLQEMLDSFTASGDRIQILELLQLLYEKSGEEITEHTTLFIADIDYLLYVQDYVNFLDKITLANYLHFKMVHAMTSMTTKPLWQLFATEVFGRERDTVKFGVTECIDAVRRKLRFVVESKLVEMEFGSSACFINSRDEMIRMFENSREVFRQAKYTSSLLRDSGNTNICVGFPDWILDESRLELEYVGLNLSRPTYLEQVLAFNEWRTVKEQRTPSLPLGANECDWNKLGRKIAFADLQRNQVYLTWKMLMPSHFGTGRQNRALSYGAMGNGLTHEFSHILDRLAFSNFEWLKKRRPDEECLVEQYGNFSFNPLFGSPQHLSGQKTLRENVADNVGLQLAYMAFKTEENGSIYVGAGSPGEFTDDQIFFIGFAQNYCGMDTLEGLRFKQRNDDHSPGKFRVIGTLQNSHDFSQAWDCPAGSNMNPINHKKCIFISDKPTNQKVYDNQADYV